jgi:hypothetical protein
MRKLTALFVGLAALAVISTTADAKGGCGSGWFFDGQRCVPKGDGPEYRHEPSHRGAYFNYSPNYRHEPSYYRPHHDYERPYHGSPRGGVHLGIGPGVHLHLGGDH